MNKPDIQFEWIEPSDNPWGIRLIDVRPFTQAMLSTSQNKEFAQNAVSYNGEDGLCFLDQFPPENEIVETHLEYKIDPPLLDGVLFSPDVMEHKWAIFLHQNKIICVRSWQREVQLIENCKIEGDRLKITSIEGTLGGDDGDLQLRVQLFDYLIRTHVLDLYYPTPCPDLDDPYSAALWCFSMFGKMSYFSAPTPFEYHLPEEPLRSNSLLHIAIARGDIERVKSFIEAGAPFDLLAQDGFTPLHWALSSRDKKMIARLLKLGSPIDVRSDEGTTPLIDAVQDEKLQQVAFLLKNGADPNAQDHRGFTALHRSCEMGFLEISEVLLRCGASARIEVEGHTPRSLAEGREHQHIIDLIDQYEVQG